MGKKAVSARGNLNPIAQALALVDPRVYYILTLAVFACALYLGFNTNGTAVFVVTTCVVMLVFCAWLANWVLFKDEGTPDMQTVSDAIRDGAEGYFATQYGAITKLSVLVAVMVYCIYLFRTESAEHKAAGITRSTNALITVLCFLLGAFCSGVAGYVGMWVSVRANVRVAGGARRSAREALQIALRAGAFSALIVVGMTVLGVCGLYCFFYVYFVLPGTLTPGDIPLLLVGYGFGASFVALFAQLGGGIYTKAADVGADLVGKVEQNIPEDDPRNPAVIADLVGDNVGDCAARGADLFESIAAEIISAMILGGTMARKSNIKDASGFIMFPLVVHSMDLVVSAAGVLTVGGKSSNRGEDPYAVMKSGYQVSLGLAVVAFIGACRFMLYTDMAPDAWMYFTACGMVGIMTAYTFVWIAQYYTDYKYKPVRDICDASATGHATNIIAGVGLGLESTALPVLTMSGALIGAYWLGNMSGLHDTEGRPSGGLFGTAVATMGMLSTAAYVLTMDMFGPISDNAGGIVEMSQQPESVREITDVLDAVGNTTKATTKGYAIGSAGLASFLLFSAYLDEVSSFLGQPFHQVDIAVPEVFVGGLLGATMVFVFSAWACSAVGRTAQQVVQEVRLQFKERPGIMTWEEKPDYARCVSIVARAALKEMVKPGLMAVCGPIVVGVLMRLLGSMTGQSMLGAKAVAGLLMFATVTGILMALFLNTAGGAWDNAKKFIEKGYLGGKGSEAHKAAVTGDTVGDPFKDTAGPSIHVLIKMLATISLVMSPLFLD